MIELGPLHHVAVAANEFFKPLIDHAGLEFIGIGSAEEYQSLATSRDLCPSHRAKAKIPFSRSTTPSPHSS